MRNPAAETSEPTSSGTREPTVLERRPEIGPATSMPSVAGTRKRPASVTDAPKPKPVETGSSTNWGTSTNEANMPKPSTSAARLVVHTGPSRIICMSTSGERLRDSTRTQSGISTTASANRPSVRADVQPQLEPWLTGTSRAISHAASSTAPSQSIRPRVLTGDSGTKTTIPMVATITAPSGNQNSQWYEKCS